MGHILQHTNSPVKFDPPPDPEDQRKPDDERRDDLLTFMAAADHCGPIFLGIVLKAVELYGLETVKRWAELHAKALRGAL